MSLLDAEKQDWRVRSQVRGLRVLSFALPLLIIGLIGSSQVSRIEPKIIWESSENNQAKLRGVVRIPDVSRSQVPVQLVIKLAKNTTKQQQQLRAMVRYEIWDEKKDLISRRTVRAEPKKQIDHTDPSQKMRSPIVLLDSNQRYMIRGQLSVHKADQRRFRSWQMQLLQDPNKPSNRWLKGLEMITFPALAISLLGLVMVFGPRLIR